MTEEYRKARRNRRYNKSYMWVYRTGRMYAERQERRQLSVRPLAEAYFTWARENIGKVPQKSKTWEGFSYSRK